MAEIRALERDDLEAVARLVSAELPGWRRSADVLNRNLVDHPWAGTPLTSLVATDDDGEIIGTFGLQERRLLFNGEELRGVSCSHLVVASESRGGAAGAMLVRRLLQGDQDLTWTDSGTADVVRIWRTFGGHVDHTRTADWMYVLRPAQWLRNVVSGAVSRRQRGRHLLPVGSVPVHTLGRRLLPGAFPEHPQGLTAEEARPEAVIDALPRLTWGVRLRVDWDAAYLEHTYRLIESLTGPIVRHLVLSRGEPIGWYVYAPRPGMSRVLHLVGDRRRISDVFAHLVYDARERGCSMLSGRLEPHLDQPLRRRLAGVALTGLPLVHARNPAVLAALASDESLISELDLVDSEWW
jgi:hypothetical protein